MALIVEHHEELEADLLGQDVDLLDFWRGLITPRRMEVLIHTLPVTSRLFGKINPRRAAQEQWSTTDYLIALLVDLFGTANYKNFERLKRPVDLFDAEQAEIDGESRAAQRLAYLQAQAKRVAARDRAEAQAAKPRRKTR